MGHLAIEGSDGKIRSAAAASTAGDVLPPRMKGFPAKGLAVAVLPPPAPNVGITPAFSAKGLAVAVLPPPPPPPTPPNIGCTPALNICEGGN